ncbi:hypothetical protein [Pseudoneobacillus sp. C159]
MEKQTVESESHLEGEHHFTYHKQTAYISFIVAMLFVMLLEGFGVSFFLFKWSPILHWMHLILCILLMTFLIADLRGVLKYPILIKNNQLSLKIGVRPEVLVDLNNISEIRSGNIHYEKDRKNKEVLDLSLLGMDGPTFEIVLDEPVETKALFGKTRLANRIFFTVDEKDPFYRLINQHTKKSP